MAGCATRKWATSPWRFGLCSLVMLGGHCVVLPASVTAQEVNEAPAAVAGAPPQNIEPGINDRFLSPDLEVEEWISRFETESREVFAAREAIADALGIEQGMRVADVGAGTGLFTRLFAGRVGPEGWVFAVDISPKFVAHLASVAHDAAGGNVTPVLCAQDSVLLPPESVDLVFVCDTYHHFEYPASTLGSIHRALRPGGRLAVVDFERIPGESSEWILNHVRADKGTFRREIEEAGFEFRREVDLESLDENYLLIFRKR